MDIQSLLSHLDSLYQTSNLSEAENLLKQTIRECRENQDQGGLLLCLNELTGLYRETGRAESGTDLADLALDLVESMDLTGSSQHGTVLLNAATVNRIAGHSEKALLYYQEAEEIFLRNHQGKSFQMASLYNNMSQLYQDLHNDQKALELQEKALFLIQSLPDSESETAVTRVNISYSCMALNRLEEASDFLSLAVGYYQSEKGISDPHRGSAFCALGHLSYLQRNFSQSAEWFEQALEQELSFHGENDACKIIRSNLQQAKSQIEIETEKIQKVRESS